MVAWLGAWLCVLCLALPAAPLPVPPQPRPQPPPWGDWVIVDDVEPGNSVLLRRITPKSVFVAPSFNGCAEGYQQDSLGRCVKLVKVNQQAQWNFFLERLNSMYAAPSSSKKPEKEAGPFHINLPIGLAVGSLEEVSVNKREPQTGQVEPAETTTISASTTPPPTPSTVSSGEESTQPASESTMSDVTEVTSTERETTLTETVTDSRRVTESSSEVMLSDQPDTTTQESFLENIPLQTPKKPSQLPEAPFVIIVTNEPTTATGGEDTTTNPPLSTEEVTVENTSTTEAIEVTEPTSTESAKTTEYESETIVTSIRPEVQASSTPETTVTVRPPCDSARDGLDSNCEPSEVEVLTDLRKVTYSLPASLPLLEPNTRVRFPAESFLPPRRTQTFIRFPGEANHHEDRPTFWYPSFELRQHPGVRGWPPPENHPSEPQYYQPPQSWYNSNTWRRRFPQRD